LGVWLRWVARAIAAAVAVGLAVWLGRALAVAGLVSLPPVVPSGPTRPAPWPRGSPVPLFRHIFLVVMENRPAQGLMGRWDTTYLSALARRYSVATNLWAAAHPSLPNYLALTAGTTYGIRTDCETCYVPGPDLASQLSRHGISWGAYLEGLPAPGSLAASWPLGLYAGKHNPFRYFLDVRHSPRLRRHLLPLRALWPALASGHVPRFVWITPNLCHDMHSCPTLAGDLWLRLVVPRILASSAYRDGGVLFVTWDEGGSSPPGAPGAGGRVLLLAVSPMSRPGGRDAAAATDASILRTIQDALGLPCLRDSCRAAPLSGLFVRR
jgi:hypothetical protein